MLQMYLLLKTEPIDFVSFHQVPLLVNGGCCRIIKPVASCCIYQQSSCDREINWGLRRNTSLRPFTTVHILAVEAVPKS